MIEKSNFEIIYKLWEDYINIYLIKNKHLKDSFFLMLCGAYFTKHGFRYIDGGEDISPRIHPFALQDSGTGKGVVMKKTRDLMDKLGLLTSYSTKEDIKSLIGMYGHPGKLITHDAVFWDEGTELLIGRNDSARTILNFLQSAMDDPGIIGKGTQVQYRSETCIATGSFLHTSIEGNFMRGGYFQRTFFSFIDNLTEEEKIDLINKRNIKKLNYDPKFRAVTIKKLKDKLTAIVLLNKKRIRFSKDSVEYVNKLNYDLTTANNNIFVGDRQRVLDTFMSRYWITLDKIAVIIAILNKKDRITGQEYKTAYEHFGKQLLKSIIDVLMHFRGDPKYNREIEMERQILAVIKRYKNITQDKLIKVMKELSDAGKWDLGYGRTIFLINNMEKMGKVVSVFVGKDRIIRIR